MEWPIITGLHLVNCLQNHVPLYRRHILNPIITLFLISQLISAFFSVDLHTSIFGIIPFKRWFIIFNFIHFFIFYPAGLR
jgi:hypothetical protein